MGIMNLTPIEPDILPLALTAVAERLEPGSVAAAAFARVAAVADELEVPQDTPDHRRAARALVDRAGMAAIDAVPATAFSWDGRAVRTRSEASVLIHEVAHWLIAPPDRGPYRISDLAPVRKRGGSPRRTPPAALMTL